MLLKLVAEGCFSAIAASFNPLIKQIQVDYVLADEGMATLRLITALSLKTSIDPYPG